MPSDLRPQRGDVLTMIKTTFYVFGALCAASGAAALATKHSRAGARAARLPTGFAGASSSAASRSRSHAHIDAARGFNHGSALLAFSALADSAVEHYRGSFQNPAMITPLVSATCALAAGLHGGRDRTEASHSARHAIYLAAAVAGVAGSAFHLYNVTKRPGGWSWHNLFYGAPIGAPMALLLSGLLGVYSERLRDAVRAGVAPRIDPKVFGLPAGKALAALVSIGLIATSGEAGLLHFCGSFQNPAM